MVKPTSMDVLPDAMELISNAIKRVLAMECQTGLMKKNIAMRKMDIRALIMMIPGQIQMPGEIQIGMILGRSMERNRKLNCLPYLLAE